MRQIAGGNRSLAHQIVFGAVLFDNFSGEGEWILAGEDVPGIAHAKSDGPDHAIKGTDLGADVVGAVTGFDVLVVGAAVEHDVAFEFAVSRVGVIGDLIGAQDVGAIVDLRVAPQVIDGSFFFLFDRSHGNRDLGLAGRGGWQSGSGCGSTIGSGGEGQRLAGYYRGSEKQMTDPGGRDKDSRRASSGPRGRKSQGHPGRPASVAQKVMVLMVNQTLVSVSFSTGRAGCIDRAPRDLNRFAVQQHRRRGAHVGTGIKAVRQRRRHPVDLGSQVPWMSAIVPLPPSSGAADPIVPRAPVRDRIVDPLPLYSVSDAPDTQLTRDTYERLQAELEDLTTRGRVENRHAHRGGPGPRRSQGER